MKALIEQCRERTPRINRIDNVARVKQLLEYMLSEGIDITIAAVCNQLIVSTETIRQWNCNSLISEMKKLQKLIKYNYKKEALYVKVQEYMDRHDNEIIKSKYIYNHIEIIRNILWRAHPDITNYITKVVNEHNFKSKL